MKTYSIYNIYVPLLRKWVKEYVSQMDKKDLIDIVSEKIHDDLETICQDQGKISVYHEMWDMADFIDGTTGKKFFFKIAKEVRDELFSKSSL